MLLCPERGDAAVGPAALVSMGGITAASPANGPYQLPVKLAGETVPDAPRHTAPDSPGHRDRVFPADANTKLPPGPLGRGLRRAPWPVLGVIAAGGAIGAVARYALLSGFPHPAAGFGWAAFGINVSGCLLIGVLMVLVTEARRAHRLVRPFLGTGVLGGFTSFSTYVVDTQHALLAGAPRVALLYAAGTALAALAAARAGIGMTRALTGMPGADARGLVQPPGADACAPGKGT
jgi:CrcB protein